MTDWRAVGRRVKGLRESNKLTQDTLADALGYSRGTLGELERGTDRAGISLVVALADYFKVPVDWLLGRDIPQSAAHWSASSLMIPTNSPG